jgi:hypothetical protein
MKPEQNKAVLPLILFIYDSLNYAISFFKPVEGSWEHGNEISGSIKFWKVLE